MASSDAPRRGFAAAMEANIAAKEERQARFLELVASGLRPVEAMRALGLSVGTLYNNWTKDPRFAREYAAVRVQGGDETFVAHDFVRFRHAFFEHDTPPHHARIAEAITSAEPRTITMILGPPNSGKTTLLVDYINFILGPIDPNYRICVITETKQLAQDIIGQVAMRMTDNAQFPAYIGKYGPFKLNPEDKKRSAAYERDFQRPWNKDYLRIHKAQHDEKNHSLEARGAGTKILGARYDMVIMDDVQSMQSFGDTDKLKRYFHGTLVHRPDPDTGRFVILGNNLGPGSFYDYLLENDLVDRLVQIPALVWDDGSPAHIAKDDHFWLEFDGRGGGRRRVVVNPHCEAKSYWPEKWSMQALAEMRHRATEREWAVMFMQKPVGSSGATFTEECIQGALSREHVVGRAALTYGLRTVASCDPALVGHSAFGVFSYDTDKLYLAHMEAVEGLGNHEAIMNVIQRVSGEFRPEAWVIEADHAQGAALYRDDRLGDMARRFGFDLVEQRTARNKSAPAFGVAALPAWLLAGDIVLPYGDDESRRQVDPLLSELRSWRADIKPTMLQQDRLMALWFAWRFWQRERDVLLAPVVRAKRPSWLSGASRPMWAEGDRFYDRGVRV